MVGLIFGIIFLIAGIIGGVVLLCIKEEDVGYEDGKRVKIVEHPLRKFSVVSFAGGVFLGLLLTFFGCFASVETGKTGVVTTFGKVENYTFESGFNFKAPWNKVIEMDNRVQKSTVDLSCFSSDIQEVKMQYTLNYQIDKANAQEIYKTIGVEYYSTIIEPNVKECVKVATAQFTAEQLVQTRTQLATDIENLLVDALKPYNIKVASTAIEDLDFTDSFTNAVEAKQVAEQKKKQAEIEQAQAIKQAEADATVAKTRADAEAAVKKIEAEAAAEIAQIQANADLEVQKINADAAEYSGKKEAAVVLNKLAGINGWNVALDEATGLYKITHSDGSPISEEERKEGVKRLIEYYYTQAWDGKLPDTLVTEDDINSILIP